ncbi:MAG: hypothetical protein K0S22_1231 [Oscillospiraceae bacterium]|jgi:hypothetical protein|nr:hypothetical protein [Oscillospiraceae bacterium]
MKSHNTQNQCVCRIRLSPILLRKKSSVVLQCFPNYYRTYGENLFIRCLPITVIVIGTFSVTGEYPIFRSYHFFGEALEH